MSIRQTVSSHYEINVKVYAITREPPKLVCCGFPKEGKGVKWCGINLFSFSAEALEDGQLGAG